MSNLDVRTGLADIATQARPVDLYDRALTRSRQIRRRRTAGAALAAAVAVAATVGLTWRMMPGLTAAPGPAESATPSSSPAPSAEPTPPPTEEYTDPAVEVTPLSNATLSFPAWPVVREDVGLGTCPTGPVTFANNAFETGTGLMLYVGSVLSVQVSGATHLLASISCGGPGQGSAQQVIAYRAVGDGFTVVDKVVDTAVTPAEGAFAIITGLTAGPTPGSIVAAVTLRVELGSSPTTYGELSQQRTYSWDGSAYVQTAGLSSFRADPTTIDLSATAGELVFGPPVEFCRTGTVTLTVTNNKTTPVADVSVALMLNGLGERAVNATACPGVPAGQGSDSVLVPVGSIEAGATRTVTATMVVDTRSEPSYGPGTGRFEGGRPGSIYADVRVGAQRTGTTVPFAIQY